MGENNNIWRNDIETRRVNYIRTKFHLSVYSVGDLAYFASWWNGFASCDRTAILAALCFLFNRNRHIRGPRCCIWQQTTFEITRVSAVAFSPFLFSHSFSLLVKSSLASNAVPGLPGGGSLLLIHFGGDFRHVPRYYPVGVALIRRSGGIQRINKPWSLYSVCNKPKTILGVRQQHASVLDIRHEDSGTICLDEASVDGISRLWNCSTCRVQTRALFCFLLLILSLAITTHI